MSITISNWDFTNTKDYMSDATINQIILKIPTRGFQPKVLQMNWKVPG